MSGLFGSTLIKGNRLTDFAQSTATVGIVIPFGYGRFTSDGNVIWAPMPPVEHRTVTRQGKGGVKQENFTYTLSYAIAFAKGPISGYWWIKRNGKIVWTQDPNAPIEDQEYAAKWRQRATFYYGTMDQLPDSTIESYEGSGQVSAHRQLAYIVVEDDDVTDGGGAVPTYEACVIADGVSYATSPPYALESTTSHSVSAELGQVGNISTVGWMGGQSHGVELVQLENRSIRITESGHASDHSQSVELLYLRNELARIIENGRVGDTANSVEIVRLENEQIRVVLDRHSPNANIHSVEIEYLENIIP